MNLDTLTELLNHTLAKNRILAIHVMDMVDEVRALHAISDRVPIEMDGKVESRLKEVGRRLNKLQREGYDTVQAICEHYNVYREVLSRAEEDELKKIQNIVGYTNEPSKAGDLKNKVILTSGQLIAAQALGVGAALGGSSVNLSSNMGSLTENLQKASKRILPTTPTQSDFSQWLKRLKSDDPAERKDMLIQLNSTNNPAALPYMAHVYMTDTEQFVRDTAKRLGKFLYWNNIYYEMTVDGTIDKIRREFAESLGIILDQRSITQETPAAPAKPQESAASILAKAEAQRRKRGQ